jgi:hypothetical protein
MWSACAMVFDVREATCPKNVIVDPIHGPVEVGQAELVVNYPCLVHTERCPRWQLSLSKMTRQNLKQRQQKFFTNYYRDINIVFFSPFSFF